MFYPRSFVIETPIKLRVLLKIRLSHFILNTNIGESSPLTRSTKVDYPKKLVQLTHIVPIYLPKLCNMEPLFNLYRRTD